MACAKQVIGGEVDSVFVLNRLTIIGNKTILWDDKPVDLYRTNDMKVKNTQGYVRLLRALASRAYETLSEEELGGPYIRGYLAILRHSLKKADPSFDAIKMVWHEGFMWDDGMTPFEKLQDIPEIEFNDLEIRWNGKKVELSPSQRRVVIYMLAKRGTPCADFELHGVAKGIRVDAIDRAEHDALKAYFKVIKDAFREIDKNFDSLRITSDGRRYWKLDLDKVWIFPTPPPKADRLE